MFAISRYETLQAELLIAFVPLGLARSIISRLPTVVPIEAADYVWVVKVDQKINSRPGVCAAGTPQAQTLNYVSRRLTSFPYTLATGQHDAAVVRRYNGKP